MSTARFFFALVLLALGASFAPACGSDARATDTCRTIETERCKRGPACAEKLDNFVGDSDSCIRFYDVQCGRGVPDDLKEPSKSELSACIGVIQTNCDAVVDPTKFVECSFLTANAQVPAADTGVAAETAVDTGTATDSADGG
ncbi:MAG: hypothetical protein ACXWUG_00560 [Polyangiales bacterium]